jgi:RNA polymerase sigma-70 factor (ECF subfamily)
MAEASSLDAEKRPNSPALEGEGSSMRSARNERELKESERAEDLRLVQSVQSGNRDAYRELVERYRRRVMALALEVTRSAEDAEDVAQETFVKAFLSLKDFKGQSSFYTWLYRIALNMAIDVRRKVTRQGGRNTEFDERTTVGVIDQKPDESPDRVLERKQDARLLDSALRELSEEHRVVLTLREIDGLSYDEIADVVGISKGTVMSRLHYARKQVQATLSEQGLGEGFSSRSSAALE